MQMPEADAGAVHRTANQNRTPFFKKGVHIIPKDTKKFGEHWKRFVEHLKNYLVLSNAEGIT